MLSIVAGEELPEHVSVVAELDAESYAEAELSDGELLGLAMEEALEAYAAGRVIAAVDDVSARRVERRRARRVADRVLRTEGVAA